MQLGFNPQKILYFYTFSMGARNMLTFMISTPLSSVASWGWRSEDRVLRKGWALLILLQFNSLLLQIQTLTKKSWLIDLLTYS